MGFFLGVFPALRLISLSLLLENLANPWRSGKTTLLSWTPFFFRSAIDFLVIRIFPNRVSPFKRLCLRSLFGAESLIRNSRAALLTPQLLFHFRIFTASGLPIVTKPSRIFVGI